MLLSIISRRLRKGKEMSETDVLVKPVLAVMGGPVPRAFILCKGGKTYVKLRGSEEEHCVDDLIENNRKLQSDCDKLRKQIDKLRQELRVVRKGKTDEHTGLDVLEEGRVS